MRGGLWEEAAAGAGGTWGSDKGAACMGSAGGQGSAEAGTLGQEDGAVLSAELGWAEG